MSKSSYIGYRPTWSEINLCNLAYNFDKIKKILTSKIKIMAIVKADAYGHGLLPVARKLVSCGVDYLGVASIDEGIRLREAQIRLPILILGVVLKNDIEPLFRYNLVPTVCTEDLVLSLNNMGCSLDRPINVQVKVDTGMGRLGVLYDDALDFIKRIKKLKFINIEGIFTHFALADMNKDFTLHQIDLFNRLIVELKQVGIHIPLVHAANSMGVISYKDSHFNMVRPGLIIYGLYPITDYNEVVSVCNGVYPAQNLSSKLVFYNIREKIKLRPVLSLKTKIVYIKRVPKDYGISYGHDYITQKDTRIANLPIGYGDGYPRNLSNKAPVLVKGRYFRISGRICMDHIMVDVGDSRVRVGDEVVLIGSQGKHKITAEQLAGLSGTIPYEIVCSLGNRIPRVYID